MPDPAPRMNPADWLRLVGLAMLWGWSFVFVQLAVPWLPALVLVWLRVALAAAALALVVAARGLPWPRRADWPALAVMGLLNNALPFTLFVLAQPRTGAALAAILNATTPVMTVILAGAAGVERMTPARLAGVLLGLAGVAVMLGPGAGAGELAAPAMCLAAAVSYAVASLWGRRLAARGLAPPTSALGMLTASAVLLAPLVLALDRPWTLAPPPPAIWAAVLALALFCTAAAYLLYFRLLADAGAVNTALVTVLVPVSAVLAGVALLGEALGLRHLAGFALIALGLAALDGRAAGGLWRIRRRGLFRPRRAR